MNNRSPVNTLNNILPVSYQNELENIVYNNKKIPFPKPNFPWIYTTTNTLTNPPTKEDNFYHPLYKDKKIISGLGDGMNVVLYSFILSQNLFLKDINDSSAIIFYPTLSNNPLQIQEKLNLPKLQGNYSLIYCIDDSDSKILIKEDENLNEIVDISIKKGKYIIYETTNISSYIIPPSIGFTSILLFNFKIIPN